MIASLRVLLALALTDCGVAAGAGTGAAGGRDVTGCVASDDPVTFGAQEVEGDIEGKAEGESENEGETEGESEGECEGEGEYEGEGAAEPKAPTVPTSV